MNMGILQVFVWLLCTLCLVSAGGYGEQTTTYEHCSNNTDIVIVVDSSASITLDDWAKMKIFIIKLIEQLSGNGVFVGINLYSTCAKVIREVEPLANHQELKTTVLKMKHLQGLTNTHLGLETCKKMLEESNTKHPERTGVSKYVILISDGMSNRDCMLTLPTAESLRSLPCSIISVAVGEAVQPGTDGYNEMVSISSSGAVISVHDYNSLSDDTIKTICKEFKITEGNPCPKGVKGIPIHCGIFRCDATHGAYHWRKFYTGCSYKGKCMKWDEDVEKPSDCNKYKCSRVHCGSSNNECSGFAVAVYKVGCEYGSDCIMEGKERTDHETCTTEKCTKLNGESGPYGKMVVTKRRCMREGQCYDYGHTYEKGCDSYKCTQAGYFAPCKRACSYNDSCIEEEDTIEDDCDVKKCVFNQKNELLEMKLIKRRCNDEGKCYDIGAKWTKISCKCVEFCCVEKNGEAVIESEIIGCRKGGDKSCTPVGDSVNKVKDSCVEYKCTKDGKFELIKAGCKDETQNCRDNGEKWRPQTGCWINICHVDRSDPTQVKTNIEKIPDCIVKGHCVLRGNTFKLDCMTFRCSLIGHVEIVSQECEYKGKCIQVGAKPFVDRVVCKTISCQGPLGGQGAPLIVDEEYGCFEYGRCYDSGAKRQDKGSCIVRQCDGDKHRFFPILCSVGKKCIKPNEIHIDKGDCVSEVCEIKTYPPGAELITKWTGCYYKRKCYKPGATRGTCTVQRCQGNNVWVTVKAACVTKDGQCREIDTMWFDEKACRQFGCKSTDGGESATIVSVVLGCGVKHDCVKSGAWIGENTCTKYQCQNGTVKQLRVACDLPTGYGYPQCLEVGKVFSDDHRCVSYTCKQRKRTRNGVQVVLIEISGCKDDRCYYVGQYKNMLCKTYICRKPSKGLELFKINGCIDENGQCKAIGATWQNEAKCMLRICRRGGSVAEKPLGCIDSNDYDKCVRFDKTMNNNGAMCQVHICKAVRKLPTRYIQYTGCEYQEKCIPFYKSEINMESCKVFTCVKKKGKPALVEKMYGCFSDIDGNCYKYGHVETEPDNKCLQYRCVRGKNSFVVSRAECLGDDGKCYKQNRVWYAAEECNKFKCRRENMDDTYRCRMINDETEGCEGPNGKCLEPGNEVKSKNCTDYVCDPQQGGLVIKTLRCQTDGGACKNIGDKWIGSKRCADFECIQASPTKVRIQMKERGCKADGKSQCYDDGKEVRKKCNVFKCDGDTQKMLPIKMGCWAKRKCHDIDSSWSGPNCITYTCILVKKGSNFVITDIEEKQGCKYKRKCFKEGDTRKEGCNEMTCGADGSWILTEFKCKAADGSCFAPGETYKAKDCTTYGCDENAQSVYPAEYECFINKECVPIGKTWFNEKACKYYKCSFDQEKNAAFREEVKIGCRRKGKECIEHGQTRENDCIKTKCEDGIMKVIDAGCEWQDGCKKINEEWYIGCVYHKCVIKRQTPTSVSTGIVIVHGCKDCYDKCHQPGVIVKRGCVQQKCLKGGKLRTIKIQCLDQSSKSCVDIGKIVIVGGQKKKCTAHGSFKVIPRPKFCEDGKGGKLATGQSYKDHDTCNTLKCVLEGYNTDWKIIKRGCRHEDHCHDLGEEWFDNAACENNKCMLQSNSGSTFPMVVALKGCKSKAGICYRIGQTWKDGCKAMECVRQGKTGSKIKIVSQGCQSEATGKCYNEGQTWTEMITAECYLFKCTKSGNSFVVQKVRQVCHDHYGKCRDVGDTYYDCDVDGSTHYGCSCIIKDGHACSTYTDNYKKPSDTELYEDAFKAIESYGETNNSYVGAIGINYGDNIAPVSPVPLSYTPLHPLEGKGDNVIPLHNYVPPPSQGNYSPVPIPASKDYVPSPSPSNDSPLSRPEVYIPPLSAKDIAQPPSSADYPLSPSKDYIPPPSVKDYVSSSSSSDYVPISPPKNYVQSSESSDDNPLPAKNYDPHASTKDYALPHLSDDYPTFPAKDYAPPPTMNDNVPSSIFVPLPPSKDYVQSPSLNDNAPLPFPNDYAPPPSAKDYAKHPLSADYPLFPSKDYALPPTVNDNVPSPPSTIFVPLPPSKDYVPSPSPNDNTPLPLPKDYAPPSSGNDYAQHSSSADSPLLPLNGYAQPLSVKDYAPISSSKDYSPPPSVKRYAPSSSPNDYVNPLSSKDYAPSPSPSDDTPIPLLKNNDQPPSTEHYVPSQSDYVPIISSNADVPPPSSNDNTPSSTSGDNYASP